MHYPKEKCMTYFGKTTGELSENDFSELSGLFNQVYNRNINASFLKKKYCSPCLGYSFHGLMYCDKGNIVGSITFIPFSYQFFDKQITAGCASDLMIHENYRKDLLSFKHLYDSALEKSKDMLDFLYAVPNSNAYLYWTKFLKWKNIGKLHYYIHVLNISKIKTKFSEFDGISRLISGCINFLTFDFNARKIEADYSIYKLISSEYIKYRFTEKYMEILESDNYAYYNIVDEFGVKTVYIIDLFPVSKGWLGKVVKIIYKREKGNMDIIIYIGNKLRAPINLFKVPRKFEPRILNLIGKALSDKVDDRIYNLDNWLFNISDFDVR
jgi:hypothetical protein